MGEINRRLDGADQTGSLGNDFSNHQLFAGTQSDVLRTRLIDDLRHTLLADRYREVTDIQDADRVIAVGPADRWICVFDSYGEGEDRNPAEFKWLTFQLSSLCPVVDIHLEDGVALHLCLFREGRRADRYGNRKDVTNGWQSEEERRSYLGVPSAWTDLLRNPQATERLSQAWQEHHAADIMPLVTELFGWSPEFAQMGYFIGTDGEWLSYRETMPLSDTSLFTEIYFCKLES